MEKLFRACPILPISGRMLGTAKSYAVPRTHRPHNIARTALKAWNICNSHVPVLKAGRQLFPHITVKCRASIGGLSFCRQEITIETALPLFVIVPKPFCQKCRNMFPGTRGREAGSYERSQRHHLGTARLSHKILHQKNRRGQVYYLNRSVKGTLMIWPAIPKVKRPLWSFRPAQTPHYFQRDCYSPQRQLPTLVLQSPSNSPLWFLQFPTAFHAH